MEMAEFNAQMKRLKDCYPKSYPDERIKYIWRIVETLSTHWFEKTCDKFIASSRVAPLPDDFLEAALLEKKKSLSSNTWQKPHPMENSIFSKEERSEMFQIMRDTVNKKIKPQDARKFSRLVQGVISERSKTKCSLCQDTGDIFAHKHGECGTHFFRCNCPIGSLKQNVPQWRDNLILQGYIPETLEDSHEEEQSGTILEFRKRTEEEKHLRLEPTEIA